MKKFLLSIVLLCAAALPLAAQTINASDCTQTAVQTAFNSITASTTLVNIPSGASSHCIWGASDSGVTLTVPPGSAGLTIHGNTVCTGDGRPGFTPLSCTDNTSIADAMPTITGNPDLPVFSISTQTGVPLTISGLTITGTGVSPVQTYAGAISVGGGSQLIRFTQDHFVNMNQVTLGMFNGNGGVVDHSIISQAQASIFARTQAATSSDWAGQIPWSQSTNLGSLNAWYFEDDELVGGSTDCDKAGRFVVRFNTFTAGPGTAQWLLTHPTGEPGGAIRGCREWEAYENTFVTNGQGVFSLWFLSAGTGVTWGNTISTAGGGSLSNFFTFISERSNNTTYGQTAVPNGWGYCGTYFNGTGSSWDQNANTVSGAKCLDNVGMGKGDLLTATGTASFPTIANTVLGGQTWPRQAQEPVYEWLDTYAPGNWVDSTQYSSISPLPIQQNNDYYLWCNAAATTGCTTFNGTQGVGSGTLGSRPSTCTTGVAYWATDQGSWNTSGSGPQGQLYNCTATNVWSLLYVPGTYPNPLVTVAKRHIPDDLDRWVWNRNSDEFSLPVKRQLSFWHYLRTVYRDGDGRIDLLWMERKRQRTMLWHDESLPILRPDRDDERHRQLHGRNVDLWQPDTERAELFGKLYRAAHGPSCPDRLHVADRWLLDGNDSRWYSADLSHYRDDSGLCGTEHHCQHDDARPCLPGRVHQLGGRGRRLGHHQFRADCN